MRFLVSALSGLVGLIVIAGVGLFLWHPDGVIKLINTLLHPARNSTAYGSALVVPGAQGKSGDIQINLQGLTSRLHYVVTLNKGACDGPILRTFNTVTADGSGNAVNTFALTNFNYTTQPNLWINVHEGDSVDGTSVACGQVQVNRTLLLNPTPTPGATHRATPTPKPIIRPAPTVVASNTSGTNTYSGSNSPSVRNIPDLPHTGVDTGDDNTYDNYAGHHKY